VHRSRSRHPRIQLYLSKRAFISRNVLLQNRHQRFGLLWAQINALKVSDLHLGFTLLLQSAEDQKEIPNIYTYLNTVGVSFAVVRSIHQPDIGLRWIIHTTFSLAAAEEKGNLSGA
jgi:hypothetical protein